jgi:type IV pilus assembly protein PilY1
MKASFTLRRLLAATFSAALALSIPLVAKAGEDIDIFTGSPVDGAKPNILFVIDSSVNWSSSFGTNVCGTATPPVAANMAEDTRFAAEMCALYTVVDKLDGAKVAVRMGLMLFTETGDNGAYVRFALRDMNDTNKTAFKKILTNMNRSAGGSGDGSGSNTPWARSMYEAFKYFGGYTDPPNATKNVAGTPVSNIAFGNTAFAGGNANNTGAKKRDYRNNSTLGSAAWAGATDAAINGGLNAFDKLASDTYISPITLENQCAKNFIVFIANGNPGTGADDTTSPAKMSPTGGVMDTIHVRRRTGIPTAATEVHAQKFDEMAEFLFETDVSDLKGQQRVRTFTVAVYVPQKFTTDPSTGVITDLAVSTSDQAMITLMKSAADVGGGAYFPARNPQELVDAINNILNDVQAVNSVFVSASLPVSVNNQGTFLNQIYMGMFRPDGTGQPRWMGNLKEYKFKLDSLSGKISLADSLNNDAVNLDSGFIKPSAVSFWTRAGNDPSKTGWPNKDFWVNNPTGTPASGSDTPDGDVVEKGGAAEMLRLDHAKDQSKRRVFTCLPTGCSSNGVAPNDFSSSTITGGSFETAFGATTSELALLVKWIRGQDNFTCDPDDTVNCGTTKWSSPEKGPGLPATVRPSIHGDVLHSRPVVINYFPGEPNCGTEKKCGPWIFYGANDGTLRATKGGQKVAIADTDGHESWAFIAPEFYSRFKRLRDGKPELRTASNIPGTLPKDYFFDGPIGVWEEPYEISADGKSTTPATPKKWIFASARRGGAVIYAFDVTDPTTPLFMWKKTAADLPNLGQAWSTPWAFQLEGMSDPVLLFGAGYDTGEDSVPPVANGDTGRGLYALNARTGDPLDGGIVKKGFIQTDGSHTIKDPVPADISLLVGTNPDGVVQVYRGYVGDTGGNIWRLDIPSSKLDSWHLYKFAALGPNKKFFYAPDVVHAGVWDVVLAGTGDREKPLVKDSQDSFFAINDVNAAAGVPATTPAALVTGDLVKLSGTGGISSAGTCTGGTCVCDPTDLAKLCKGWYRDLALGEKVVNSPLTVAGTTYFSTNRPKPPEAGSCNVDLGDARAYGLTFYGGTPNKTQPDGTIGTPLTGGGLPPSPVGGVVQFEDGKQVAFIIGGGDKGSSVEGGRVTIPVASTRRKLYWNAATDK